MERSVHLPTRETDSELKTLYSYVYYTQIMQAETLASAYRLWRRNWRGHGREYTAGALVWQVGAARVESEFAQYTVCQDQRLLASNVMGYRRLFSAAQTCLLCDCSRVEALHSRHDPKGISDL